MKLSILIILSFFAVGLQAQNEKVICPFTIENGKIILQYPQNGQIVRLRLSSVENFSILSDKTARKFNYKYVVKGDSFPVFQYRLPFYQVDDKPAFGEFHFVSDFSGIEELKDLDGILGSLFLETNLVNLDLKNKKVTISKTLEDDFSGEKGVVLPILNNHFNGNRIFYTPGRIESNHQTDSACIVLNVIDTPLQVQMGEPLYNKELQGNFTILSPVPFQTKMEGSKIRILKNYPDMDKSVVYLGLDHLQKFKNVIFDYPHNRVLLVE